MTSRGDLKRRLARLDTRKQKPDSKQTLVSTDDLDEVCRRLGLSGGEDVAQAWQRDYPPPADTKAPDFIRALDPFFTRDIPDDLQAADLLFLDTETTGLAGGTGSLAFLVGLAWWRDGGLCVRQYFLSGPGREGPMLQAIAQLAVGYRAVVTFNGGTFDLPLLRTRFLLARVENPFANMLSLDLLPAARRLWGRSLPDCRQQTVETEVCGMARHTGDIDGALIPQVYFDFLRNGRPGLLPNVLCHNQRDMVGMGKIFRRIVDAADRLDRPEESAAGCPWREAWSCARILEAQGRSELAARWLMSLLSGPRSAVRLPGRAQGDCPEAFCRDLLRIMKRGSDWPLVQQLIGEALERFPEAAWLHREAAILYEHRLCDLRKALDHAARANEPGRLQRVIRRLQRESS